jgi:hypothetical protein
MPTRNPAARAALGADRMPADVRVFSFRRIAKHLNQCVMAARIIEARGDQPLHAERAHVAEGHRRAGWVFHCWKINMTARAATKPSKAKQSQGPARLALCALFLRLSQFLGSQVIGSQVSAPARIEAVEAFLRAVLVDQDND